MFLLWLLILVVYFLVSKKVATWLTISRLGFKSEAPQLYIHKPYFYHYFCNALLLALLTVAVWHSSIPDWLFIIGIVVFFAASTYGRMAGLRLYRNILSEMLLEDDTNANEIKTILKKDNNQIWSEMIEKEKLFNVKF